MAQKINVRIVGFCFILVSKLLLSGCLWRKRPEPWSPNPVHVLPTTAGEFNVLWDNTDENGLPRDPYWEAQTSLSADAASSLRSSTSSVRGDTLPQSSRRTGPGSLHCPGYRHRYARRLPERTLLFLSRFYSSWARELDGCISYRLSIMA